MNFTHDYTQCMMTKLFMAQPDRRGGSLVYCDCDKALEIIRQTDNMTPGVKKIIYLVGWQYNGHDDKYPAFFEVNEGIKGKNEKTALESLLRLMQEAKKYNTTVSLHINFTDAYEDSPLFPEYEAAGALIRDGGGRPAAIERYNGKRCYKVSYKEEWTSGLFVKRAERLFAMLPIESAGTVHVDNFQCYVNRKPFVSAQEEMFYRDKMIAYLRAKGVDITTEFTYREGRGTRMLYGKITRDVTPTRYPVALLGKVPAVWWADKMTRAEYYAYYPHILGGGMPKNKWAAKLFYGNIHCEDIWKTPDWHGEFKRQFFTINLPFFYLNGKKRSGFADRRQRIVQYEDGTISHVDGIIVSPRGDVVKTSEFVFLPMGCAYGAYARQDMTLRGRIDAPGAKIYELTGDGASFLTEIAADSEGKIKFDAKGDKAYYIVPKKEERS